jgi:hypothetical protein
MHEFIDHAPQLALQLSQYGGLMRVSMQTVENVNKEVRSFYRNHTDHHMNNTPHALLRYGWLRTHALIEGYCVTLRQKAPRAPHKPHKPHNKRQKKV